MTTTRRALLACIPLLAFAVVTLSIIVSVTGYIALQDYGEWIYQATVGRSILSGQESEVGYFKNYPVPYASGQLLLIGLALVASPATAGILAIAAQILLGLAAVAFVVSRRDLSPWVAVPLLGTVLVFSSGFWNGYTGFQIGMAILLFYLGVPESRRTRAVPVAVVSLTAFASHGFAYLAIVVVVATFAVYARQVVSALIGGLPSAGLALWYVLASPSEPNNEILSTDSPAQFVAYKIYSAAKAGGYQNLVVNGQGDERPLMALGAVANVLVVATVALMVVHVLVRRHPRGPRVGAELAAGLALLVLGLAMPSSFVGLVNPGERLLVPALLLCLVSALSSGALPHWLPRVGLAAASAGLVLTGVSAATLVHKADTGEAAPQDPSPSFSTDARSRTESLFAHRLDQMETRFDLAQSAWLTGEAPSDPMVWDTAMLGASSSRGVGR
ncbi:MAG: hypothetical protein ABIR39_10170 [Nocardioides sp.]|uniref:hypothetical protein n=1 Tax=Nocardioides sp. TaxID=35761 RepID=UPI0032633151